jgi:hypothetical protein
VGTYAPEEERAEDTQEFYKTIQDILQNMNKNDFLCVAGNMNARVGNKPLHFILATSGENTVNQNGRKLIEFAIENELGITNPFLKLKDVHKFTWSARNCRSIIDYVFFK